jgi:hypothetical protein
VAANGAFTGVAGGIGVGDLAAAGVEDLVELHAVNSFFLPPSRVAALWAV